MGYPGNFYRLVVEGPGYGPERWSWSLNLAESGGSIVGSVGETVPPAIRAAVTAFHQTTGLISAAAKIDTIKFNPIKPDGKYLFATESVRDLIAPPIQAGSSSNPPPQLTMAVTLLTSRARGRGSRGRFYPPYPVGVLTLGTDGRMIESAAQSMANAAATMVNAINAATDPNNPDVAGLRVVVASDLGNGLFEPVTAVSVGRVVDTLRSRRTSLVEARVGSTVTVSAPP